jgi:hypothetical protein
MLYLTYSYLIIQTPEIKSYTRHWLLLRFIDYTFLKVHDFAFLFTHWKKEGLKDYHVLFLNNPVVLT